jgi:hypothetical protein
MSEKIITGVSQKRMPEAAHTQTKEGDDALITTGINSDLVEADRWLGAHVHPKPEPKPPVPREE